MRITVGTKNKAKVAAVLEILAEYPHLKKATVEGTEVPSGIGDQPLSLDETIRGAQNRAKAAFATDSAYSIGIESGLMEVPHTKSGYMDVCVAAIYDGTQFHLGLSSGWEFPDPKVTEMMTRDGLDMSQAVNQAGLTNDASIGSNAGAIGILTKGRLDRKEYTKQALRVALIHIDTAN